MPEFLHQVVKKREREMEMRGLLDFDSEIFTRSREHVFRVPTITMPSANQISYSSNTNNGVTQHCVLFPNVNSWVQSEVRILTSSNITLRSPQMLSINAWEMLAGHPCRPNYTWENNTYVCSSCSGRYTTDGSEWQGVVHPTSQDLGAN
jgi:hypothetical protein